MAKNPETNPAPPSGPSLVELTQLAGEVEKALIDSGGELNEHIEKALLVVETELPRKIDSYDFLLRKFEKECELWRQQADRFNKVAAAFDRAREMLRARIQWAMEQAQLTELAGQSVKFKLVKSPPALIVEDEAKIPEAYFETVITKKLKKDAVKNDLKAGFAVEGAVLKQGNSLRALPNKGDK